MDKIRTCQKCHEPYEPKVFWQRFCSPTCKQASLRFRTANNHFDHDEISPIFWSRVRKGRSCWEWIGGLHNGYGRLVFKGQDLESHRISWVLSNGPIPDGLWVLHHCDNRRCVRPDHLCLGDIIENTKDRDRKNRQARGRKLGEAQQRGKVLARRKAICAGE